MSLEMETLKRMLHEEIDQLEDMSARKRLQYLLETIDFYLFFQKRKSL